MRSFFSFTTRARRRRSALALRGLTLVEIMVAVTILAFIMATILSAFVLSRRLTEAAVYNESTNSIVQGYIEQIKNMDYASVNLSPAAGTAMTGTYSTATANQILTQLDETTADTLVLSPLPVINPATLTTSASVGTVPSAAYDNVKNFTVTRTNDLTIHLWLWVEDKTPSGITPAQQVKGITLIYLTRFMDGVTPHYSLGSIHSFRSLVPTY